MNCLQPNDIPQERKSNAVSLPKKAFPIHISFRIGISKLGKLISESALAQWAYLHLAEFLIDVLRQGPIPEHVAFIMDGNRRYAGTNNMPIEMGHSLGGDAMDRVITMCYKCGVKVVTVYAFSLENFHRPKEQVDKIMELFKSRVSRYYEHGGFLRIHGTKIRALGRLELLDDDVRKIVNEAVDVLKDNQTRVLNACVAYTGRDEITTAVRKTVEEYHKTGEEITTQSLSDNMFTVDDPPLDLLETDIEVVDTLWPEFGLWDMFWIFLNWQRKRRIYGSNWMEDSGTETVEQGSEESSSGRSLSIFLSLCQYVIPVIVCLSCLACYF
ncbi:hypothetical protein VTN00DRAFT_8986 [Thermoascus crustaceus]|uniref:uncharacterized protein n=1 Tax=Thermoascus crustaceus TaxID=5088 RepID=UPI0037421830